MKPVNQVEVNARKKKKSKLFCPAIILVLYYHCLIFAIKGNISTEPLT